MKKKNRGFTLIELLAVIVILAIIALIAVPQVIKILNKSRLSAAEDSTYGIIKSVDTYVANFMLKNDGSFPTGQMKFNCNSGGCKLDTNLTGYNLNGLEELNFKGSKPRDGEVVVSNNGQTIKVNNLKINGFICNYPNNDGKVSCENSNQSLEISIGLTQTIDSIKVVVSTNVNVKEYEYSIDGENYYKSTDNTYIFTGLKQNTEYTIYVRVSNGKETKEEKSKINTLSLNIPEITVDKKDIWTQSKTVTIKYPSGENLIYSYKIKSPDGNTILVDDTLVTEETTNIEVTENSIVVATVTLGSNFQSITEEVTNIDRTEPTIEINSGTKTIDVDTNAKDKIYTMTVGASGGKVTCKNNTTGTNVTTYDNLRLGLNNVTCTIVNGVGVLVNSTADIIINQKLLFSSNSKTSYYGLFGKSNLSSGDQQYGPYKLANKGIYKITYHGKGFGENHQALQAYQNANPNISFDLLNISYTDTSITYYIHISEDLSGSGLEVKLYSYSNMAIDDVTIEYDYTND